MMEFLNHEVGFGVTWGQLVALVCWVVGSMFLGKAIQVVLGSIGKRKRFEDRRFVQIFIKALSRPVPVLFLTLGLDLGLKAFVFSPAVQGGVSDAIAVLYTFSITFFIYSLVDVVDFSLSRFGARTPSKMDDMLAPMVRKCLRVVIVVLSLVQVAQILSDKPITSILAGLGVGGLAIALAAQETIKNFFGSLVIFADKPFELGEKIIAGGKDGVVEEVGFRSTRIRTAEGHLVTIPNGELANMMVENVGKRPCIKRVMDVGVTYDTTPEKMQEAIDILKELLDNHEGMNPKMPPRVFFSDFMDCSLNIRAIYWYHPPEYWEYIAFSEKLNMELLRRYNEAGIEFAFPTQTIHMAGSEERG